MRQMTNMEFITARQIECILKEEGELMISYELYDRALLKDLPLNSSKR